MTNLSYFVDFRINSEYCTRKCVNPTVYRKEYPLRATLKVNNSSFVLTFRITLLISFLRHETSKFQVAVDVGLIV